MAMGVLLGGSFLIQGRRPAKGASHEHGCWEKIKKYWVESLKQLLQDGWGVWKKKPGEGWRAGKRRRGGAPSAQEIKGYLSPEGHMPEKGGSSPKRGPEKGERAWREGQGVSPGWLVHHDYGEGRGQQVAGLCLNDDRLGRTEKEGSNRRHVEYSSHILAQIKGRGGTTETSLPKNKKK